MTTSKAIPGTCLWSTSTGRPTHPVTVDAHRVGRWRFLTLRRPVDNSRDIVDLDVNLDQLTDKERTVVRLALTGTLTVTDRSALDACMDKYARLFANLRTWDSHTDIAVMPADGEFDDPGNRWDSPHARSPD